MDGASCTGTPDENGEIGELRDEQIDHVKSDDGGWIFRWAENWALDWHQYSWGEELERMSIEQLRAADMLLFGRVTYEGMAAYWKTVQGEVANYMNTLPKAVFARTLEAVDW